MWNITPETRCTSTLPETALRWPTASLGETKKAEVFVAILPFSHYTYCEAVWSQRKEDLIKGCEGAMQYFGGVPAAIVPDNLKAAVSRSDRNEPVINEVFAAFAEHYGCAVYPARVRHPKDKALVENAVKLLYKSVYADIEGMTFGSLDELNTAIHISLLDFNEKTMAGRDVSRVQMFNRMEKDMLRPLPEQRFTVKEHKLMTVGKNCYVSLFKHHYSVPREHVGKRVVILYDADTVEIQLNTGVSPAVIVPTDGGENFLYMVLPVRLKAAE